LNRSVFCPRFTRLHAYLMHHREMPTGPHAAGERDHFARLAARYDRLRPLDHNWEEMLARLVDEAQLAGRRVLEVGTRTGRLAVALTERYACSVVATGRVGRNAGSRPIANAGDPLRTGGSRTATVP